MEFNTFVLEIATATLGALIALCVYHMVCKHHNML